MNRSKAKRLLTLLALLVVSIFGSTLGEVPAQQSTDSRVFRISVVDLDGKPYAGLKPEDLEVWVDKTPRKIVALTTANTPVSVGILLDLSGSFGPSGKREANAFRRKLSDALTQFLKAGNAENEYFVGTFNTRVAFSETWIGPGPEQSIFEKLDGPEQYGTTAMYDALYHGIEHVMKGRHSRRVILMITDGLDNESQQGFKEVAKLVKRSDVSIYAVGIYDEGYGAGYGVRKGMGVLDELTRLSGGRTVYLKTSADPELVKDAFQIIADNLQSQYQLTIENEAATGREKWRKLKLKLNLPEDKTRPKLDVWSRLGFYQ
jgi:Ca-activated chloride channel family protein